MDTNFWQFVDAHATGIGALVFVGMVIMGAVLIFAMATLYDWLMKDKK